MAVCIIWVSVGSKMFMPPCLSNRGNTVPYLPKIYGKPCTWWQELNLELDFETQSSLSFFEVLYLVFACICNGKDFKVIKLWNTCDTSVLYSIKSTRCGGMIYIHPCSLFPLLMYYHCQFCFSCEF